VLADEWYFSNADLHNHKDTRIIGYEIWMVFVQISWYIDAMISRDAHLKNISALLQDSPVAAMIGARQVGKATLARTDNCTVNKTIAARRLVQLLVIFAASVLKD